MQKVKSTLFALLCSGLLGACGFRGPLYLPEDQPPARPDSPQNTETTEKDQDDSAA